jgi:hypothetical protein
MLKKTVCWLFVLLCLLNAAAHAEENSAEDTDTGTVSEYNEDSGQNDDKRERPRYSDHRIDARFLAGLSYKSDYFWRGSDFYGEKSGVTAAYVNMSINMLFMQAMYERPGANLVNSDPEHYDAFSLSAIYRADTGLLFSPYFKVAWKYLPDAEKINTSSLVSGTFGINSWFSKVRVDLSYTRDFYTDDMGGDRETFEDYLFRAGIGIYENSFILSSTYLAINIYAEYFNNSFINSKATAVNESRQGVSDITGQLIMGFQVTDAVSVFGEFNYAWMPDSDWSAYARTRDWFGFGFNVRY